MKNNDVRDDLDADDDDRPIGHVLSRREVLALVGATGLVACTPNVLTSGSGSTSPVPVASSAAAAASTTGGTVATPSCIVRPALTEGPYFVDEKLNRSDVRANT